jgi:hypothetical protein
MKSRHRRRSPTRIAPDLNVRSALYQGSDRLKASTLSSANESGHAKIIPRVDVRTTIQVLKERRSITVLSGLEPPRVHSHLIRYHCSLPRLRISAD